MCESDVVCLCVLYVRECGLEKFTRSSFLYKHFNDYFQRSGGKIIFNGNEMLLERKKEKIHNKNV